jgi:hypothetical protein
MSNKYAMGSWFFIFSTAIRAQLIRLAFECSDKIALTGGLTCAADVMQLNSPVIVPVIGRQNASAAAAVSFF